MPDITVYLAILMTILTAEGAREIDEVCGRRERDRICLSDVTYS